MNALEERLQQVCEYKGVTYGHALMIIDCDSVEQALSVMSEVLIFYNDYPSHGCNTRSQLVIDDEEEKYQVIIEDI